MDFTDLESLAAENIAVTLLQSTVTSIDPLCIKGGIRAKPAASCLVRPDLGDIVMCTSSHHGMSHILAVLERSQPEQTMTICSDSEVELQFPKIGLISEEIDVVADRANVNLRIFSRIAERIDDTVEFLSSSVGTLFMRAKRSIRRVEELDETRAGHLRLESPTLVEIHGEVTAISGEQMVKVQGQQIHMG